MRCDCGAYVHEACLRKYNSFTNQTQCTKTVGFGHQPLRVVVVFFFRSIKGLCFRPKQ